jgi:hypothetical protein
MAMQRTKPVAVWTYPTLRKGQDAAFAAYDFYRVAYPTPPGATEGDCARVWTHLCKAVKREPDVLVLSAPSWLWLALASYILAFTGGRGTQIVTPALRRDGSWSGDWYEWRGAGGQLTIRRAWRPLRAEWVA